MILTFDATPVVPQQVSLSLKKLLILIFIIGFLYVNEVKSSILD